MSTGDALAPFGARLRAAMTQRGQLCVGIDPHPALLAAWGLSDDATGLERFALTCVEALAGRVAVLKPQSAFFERHGSAGIAVLERLLVDARSAGSLTLVDAKRGDIGSTMDAYAFAYLDPRSPLVADAVTVSPYLGYGSLRPAIDLAKANGRGVFVLALTSNPEGASVQHARGLDGRTVVASVLGGAAVDNAAGDGLALGRLGVGGLGVGGVGVGGLGVGDLGVGGRGVGDLGSVGLVVGATVGSSVADLALDLAGSRAPLLAPGLGAQGAGPQDLVRVFGDARHNVLPTMSRGVLRAGPSIAGLRDVAARTIDEVAAALT